MTYPWELLLCYLSQKQAPVNLESDTILRSCCCMYSLSATTYCGPQTPGGFTFLQPNDGSGWCFFPKAQMKTKVDLFAPDKSSYRKIS